MRSANSEVPMTRESRVRRIKSMRWARVLLATSVMSSIGLVAATSSGASSSGYQSAHAGGTLHLVASTAGGTLDPQVNYTLQYWQLYQATCDGLVSFQKVPGAASFDVVPDLATSMPKVTNGGKTYTFTLRKEIGRASCRERG